jgi:hypothetical protein
MSDDEQSAAITAKLQQIISGIIGGDYIKAGTLDRGQIIRDIKDACSTALGEKARDSGDSSSIV